jgi:hypothetical protein
MPRNLKKKTSLMLQKKLCDDEQCVSAPLLLRQPEINHTFLYIIKSFNLE